MFATTASVRTPVAGYVAANATAADSAKNLVGGIAFIGSALRQNFGYNLAGSTHGS